MNGQHTLLTCHKGVDLHAATALKVMRVRLEGGEHLLGLARADYVTFWEPAPADLAVDRLLALGRYFNPNKHHYGYFWSATGGKPWFASTTGGESLPQAWPGEARDTDWGEPTADLYDRLLGGMPAAGTTAVDICTFSLGEPGPLLSGVLWRLFLQVAESEASQLADQLAVTRRRRQGLLVNPHMQGWLIQVRSQGALRTARQAGSREES